MENFLRLLILLALTFSVRGKVPASHLSNKRDVSYICVESSITPVSCANAGILGLMPHPDDCRLFYQCAYGIPFCQRCPPGLHFNPSKLVCDASDQAGCVIGPESTSEYLTTTEAQFNLLPHIDNDEESIAHGNNIPARCVANSVTWVSCAEMSSPDSLLPHPDDCNLFYYCVSAASAPICRQCPANLNFNPELHVCDLPEHAGCQSGNTSVDPALKVLFA